MIIWWHCACALRKWSSGGTAHAHFANDHLVALRTSQMIIWWHCACALRKWLSGGTAHAHFANNHLVALRTSQMIIWWHCALRKWSSGGTAHAHHRRNTGSAPVISHGGYHAQSIDTMVRWGVEACHVAFQYIFKQEFRTTGWSTAGALCGRSFGWRPSRCFCIHYSPSG